jgi:hypothetical protein
VSQLFERVKGYESTGFRVLEARVALNSYSQLPLTRRVLSLRFAPQAFGQEIVDAIVVVTTENRFPIGCSKKAAAVQGDHNGRR